MQLVHDYSPAEFRNNVIGLAKLGKVFKLPTVLTTSYDQGPNGPIIPELLSMFPGALLACPACDGRLRLIALIVDPRTIRAILDACDRPTALADRAPPRRRSSVTPGTPA
jgi:hypothetical protein